MVKCYCEQCRNSHKKDYTPAYLDSSKENLKHGYFCFKCGRPYYNCVCRHE